MICKKCGASMTDGSLFCPACGARVEKEEPVKAAEACAASVADKARMQNFSVASMVLGILGMVFPFFVLSILAIVFGCVSGKLNGGRKNGMATAGFVLGIVSLALSVLVIVFIILFSTAVFMGVASQLY